MENVKIFNCTNMEEKSSDLEAEINKWLNESKKKIEIISRNVVSVTVERASRWPFVNCTVVIFYKD